MPPSFKMRHAASALLLHLVINVAWQKPPPIPTPTPLLPREEERKEIKKQECGRLFGVPLSLGSVSSWKSRSLFCHTGLFCSHSLLEHREGLRDTVCFSYSCKMTAIEMLQFSVGSLYPAVPPYEQRILPLQHFQQVFLHLLSFFCCIFAHRLLGARSVRTLNVRGLL